MRCVNTKDPGIANIHQYALLNKNSSIHSTSQLEPCQNNVNDMSFHVTGGIQQIETLYRYVIPLVVQTRFARLHIRPCTDTEWESLPHGLPTAEDDWDSTIIDHKFKEDKAWGDDGQPKKCNKSLSPFDDFGNYWHHVGLQYTDFFQQNDGSIDLDDTIDQCVYDLHQIFVEEDIVVFYDVHENGINGYNDDFIQVPAIIPKVTTKQEPDFDYDWSKTVYGDLKQMKSEDSPEPLGNFVTMSHYVDANLMHDIITGKSVTDIFHLVNKTRLEWYSKKQLKIETSTYGAKFVASQTCIEQIFDLCKTGRYLSVPICNKSCTFGGNKSVLDSCTQVSAKLHK
jgi:hypothetical protein